MIKNNIETLNKFGKYLALMTVGNEQSYLSYMEHCKQLNISPYDIEAGMGHEYGLAKMYLQMLEELEKEED